MPNYYAHLEFGRRVLESLPPALRRTVEREKDAFEVGLYGPDPLYFYYPIPRSGVRRVGLDTHHQAARIPMERLLQAARSRQSMALGYAAGLLCHYALDSACHPIIHTLCARGALSHGAMEAELDRRLIVQTLLDPLQDTPMPEHELEDAVYEAAAVAYPGVSPWQFKQTLENFYRLCRLLTLVGGTRLRETAERLADRHKAFSKLHGRVLDRQPDPRYDASSIRLNTQLLELVGPTAEQLSLLVEAVRTPNLTLSQWYNQDFDGRIPREAQSSDLVPGAASASI